MFDKELDIIILAPVNFAEIVAKTAKHERPITAADCEREYAKAQNMNRQAFVFIAWIDNPNEQWE